MENPEITPLEECQYHLAVQTETSLEETGGEIGSYAFPPMQVAEVEVRGGIDDGTAGLSMFVQSLATIEWLCPRRLSLYGGLYRASLRARRFLFRTPCSPSIRPENDELRSEPSNERPTFVTHLECGLNGDHYQLISSMVSREQATTLGSLRSKRYRQVPDKGDVGGSAGRSLAYREFLP